MTSRAEHESVREHGPTDGKPLPNISQLWQFFSEPIYAVLRQNVLNKLVRLFTITISLAGVSFAGVTISSPEELEGTLVQLINQLLRPSDSLSAASSS